MTQEKREDKPNFHLMSQYPVLTMKIWGFLAFYFLEFLMALVSAIQATVETIQGMHV